MTEKEKDLAQGRLQEAKGYYNEAKEAMIEREKERGDRRMMRECRGLLRKLEAAHGIGSMQDKRDLEAERKKRDAEELSKGEKADSLKATTAVKKREEESTRRTQEKEDAAERAAEDKRIEAETRKRKGLMKRTKADDAKSI